eukprot:SAG31_NODE_2_length_46263_cov_45.908043_27_plen_154_part_00
MKHCACTTILQKLASREAVNPCIFRPMMTSYIQLHTSWKKGISRLRRQCCCRSNCKGVIARELHGAVRLRSRAHDPQIHDSYHQSHVRSQCDDVQQNPLQDRQWHSQASGFVVHAFGVGYGAVFKLVLDKAACLICTARVDAKIQLLHLACAT